MTTEGRNFLDKRLKSHNADASIYSKRYSPWELEAGIGLKDKKVAEDLERYLKTGSGVAFLKKRLPPVRQNPVVAKLHSRLVVREKRAVDLYSAGSQNVNRGVILGVALKSQSGATPGILPEKF